MKTERTQIDFLTDALVAVVSLDLKVRNLLRFEALAYVLPHFDELTHVLRSSFKGLLSRGLISRLRKAFIF